MKCGKHNFNDTFNLICACNTSEPMKRVAEIWRLAAAAEMSENEIVFACQRKVQCFIVAAGKIESNASVH